MARGAVRRHAHAKHCTIVRESSLKTKNCILDMRQQMSRLREAIVDAKSQVPAAAMKANAWALAPSIDTDIDDLASTSEAIRTIPWVDNERTTNV